MIINSTDFPDVPRTLDGEVLLDSNANGFLTCSQESAYMYSVATQEQKILGGHDKFDYSQLPAECLKPSLEFIESVISENALARINELDIPAPARAALETRVGKLLTDLQAEPTLDDAIRLALQIPIDIEAAQ